jgi:GMP synthase (glutamine-hydrolysing)
VTRWSGSTAPTVLVIEHEQAAGDSLVGQWLRDAGVQLEVCRPYAGDAVPQRVDADGLLVLGGAMGALEDDVAPWLPGVRSLLRHAVADEVPTWGICLGAQLLVAALGGEVVRGPVGPEVGVTGLTLDAGDDPVFGPMPRLVQAVQFHQDSVSRLPAGATLLASSSLYANQVFRVGACAWGVQCHPEVTASQVADWTREESMLLDAAGVNAQDVVQQVRARQSELEALWAPVARRWATLLQPRCRARSSLTRGA